MAHAPGACSKTASDRIRNRQLELRPTRCPRQLPEPPGYRKPADAFRALEMLLHLCVKTLILIARLEESAPEPASRPRTPGSIRTCPRRVRTLPTPFPGRANEAGDASVIDLLGDLAANWIDGPTVSDNLRRHGVSGFVILLNTLQVGSYKL